MIGEAAPSGARVLSLELVVPAGDTPHTANMIDLTMLGMLTGRERPTDEPSPCGLMLPWQEQRGLVDQTRLAPTADRSYTSTAPPWAWPPRPAPARSPAGWTTLATA